jgi:hypothetical protein
LEDGAGAAAAMGGGAAEADATGPFARPAADATTGLPFPDLPLGRGSRHRVKLNVNRVWCQLRRGEN